MNKLTPKRDIDINQKALLFYAGLPQAADTSKECSELF
jgi:hypothetical protein